MAQGIVDIRNSRDAALAAFNGSISAVGNLIVQTTSTSPFFDQLNNRYHDLMTQRNAILAAAGQCFQLTERHRGSRYA
jgi:hypothetical protein